MVAAIGVVSCKKRIHSNAPTPNNVRVMSYQKITTIKMTAPVGTAPTTITESYRFYYDISNRLSQIIYTGNDSFQIHKRIDFAYYPGQGPEDDTVTKTTTDLLSNLLVERDTFIVDRETGQLETAYTPQQITNYMYSGKLLYRVERAGTSHRAITTSDFSTYTSVNGDFLRHYSDNMLKIELSTALKSNLRTKIVTVPALPTDTLDAVSSQVYSYNLPYAYKPTYIWVRDTNDVKDSLLYPGVNWVDENYHFYTENANRPGDWMWLESFTYFGTNIYQNAHLVESVASRNKNAAITYEYDSDSKIKQTRVVVQDSVLNKFTMIYDIQYETY